MRLYLTLTKKRLAIICAAVLLLIGICGRFAAVSDITEDASSNALRVDFAASVGCDVDETAVSVKQVRIPDEFSEVYKQYNALQKQAGYDLEGYKGCTVTLYTYKVLQGGIAGEETFVNLIVYRGRVIGGDISTAALDGSMLPLKKSE